MKDIKYYQTPIIPAPRKSHFTRFQVNDVMKGGIIHKSLTAQELMDQGFKVVSQKQETDIQTINGVKYVVIFHYDQEGFDAEHKKHQDCANNLMQEFEDDLAKENCVTPRSKTHGIIWTKAWADGHSSGLNSVADEYSEHADFAEEIIKAAAIDD